MCMAEEKTYGQIIEEKTSVASLGATDRLCRKLGLSADVTKSSLLRSVSGLVTYCMLK